MKRPVLFRELLPLSLVLALVGAALFAAEASSSAMTRAAASFLESLSPEQRQAAVFPFLDDERLRWHFIPTEQFPRRGLTIKEMSAAQRERARDLLKAGLSQRGYLTASAIMDLETVLGALEAERRAAAGRQGGLVRDPERYYFSIFGTPAPRETWGWRVEGHHLSLHLNVVNGRAVASSPQFLGSNPAEVREGPSKGLRVLGSHEDAARELLDSLDASQRAAAILQPEAPRDIATMNALDINPLSPGGIRWSALTAKQRDSLLRLVGVYTSVMAADIAAERTRKLEKAGKGEISFAWAGPVERGMKHYYRVQGPTFLIEYDNTQDDGNHIHSVWRDFAGDFGRDLLREHLSSTPHAKPVAAR
jgi:hypothetical protein